MPRRTASAAPTVTIVQSNPLSGADRRSASIRSSSRAEPDRLPESLGRRLDRQDLARAPEPRPLERVRADTARADYGAAAPRFDRDRLDRGPDPGDDGAPDQRRDIGRHAVRKRDGAFSRDDDVLREA
jgi:hypothetical protein